MKKSKTHSVSVRVGLKKVTSYMYQVFVKVYSLLKCFKKLNMGFDTSLGSAKCLFDA